MNKFISAVALTLLMSQAAMAETRLTIATVNNADMITMQELSAKFEQENPDIEMDWVVLEENTLRQRVTTDITTKSGQ